MNEFGTKEIAEKEEEAQAHIVCADPVFYGTKDVARVLGCSIPTANDIMHRPDFPLILVGRKYKVYKSAFEEWAMQRRT